jgi:hypothetical protein
MCQVSSGEFCLVDPCVDLGVDFIECTFERDLDGAETREHGGEGLERILGQHAVMA